MWDIIFTEWNVTDDTIYKMQLFPLVIVKQVFNFTSHLRRPSTRLLSKQLKIDLAKNLVSEPQYGTTVNHQNDQHFFIFVDNIFNISAGNVLN